MPHWKTLLDPTEYIGAADFPTPKTVTISRVVREKMKPREKDEAPESAPMIYFSFVGKELPRKYKAPKSVLYGLECMFGSDYDQWKGKEVTLYAAKCLSFGDIEECVRIQVPDDIEAKIGKWLKKRKSSFKAYLAK